MTMFKSLIDLADQYVDRDTPTDVEELRLYVHDLKVIVEEIVTIVKNDELPNKAMSNVDIAVVKDFFLRKEKDKKMIRAEQDSLYRILVSVDFNQTAAAAIIGCSPPTVGNWMNLYFEGWKERAF